MGKKSGAGIGDLRTFGKKDRLSAISHVTCTLLFNGRTDETDFTDLNGLFQNNPFHPFCYPVLVLIHMGNC
jgi:hypothetical protein